MSLLEGVMTMNLIDEKEVLNDGAKRSSPFREPVPSENMIAPYISIAMEQYIVPLLGRSFYNELVGRKEGRISSYYPNSRLNDPVIAAFTDTKTEELWRIGGLREYCGWCAAVVCGRYITAQVAQGGLSEYEGVREGLDDKLIHTWEVGLDVIREKVESYLLENIENTSFEKYKKYYELLEKKDVPIIREIGLLRLNFPKW